jgi:hypothetical protein
MLSTTIVSQLPAKYQRWRSVVDTLESVEAHYVAYKGVAMADQLSRQGKWYKASSSLLLHALSSPWATRCRTRRTHHLRCSPTTLRRVARARHGRPRRCGQHQGRARGDATQIGKLLAVQNFALGGAEGAQASARAARGVQAGRQGDLHRGTRPRSLCRGTMDGTTLLEQVFSSDFDARAGDQGGARSRCSAQRTGVHRMRLFSSITVHCADFNAR